MVPLNTRPGSGTTGGRFTNTLIDPNSTPSISSGERSYHATRSVEAERSGWQLLPQHDVQLLGDPDSSGGRTD
jgi:hypothetical protein